MAEVWSSPVRFVEVDQQGVVFHGHYLTWADEAVNSWWSAAGVRWPELNARGIEYYVKASALEWLGSARLGDVVAVDVELDRIGTSSVTLCSQIRVGERTCCTVRTTYVATVDGRSTPWPDDVRARIGAG